MQNSSYPVNVYGARIPWEVPIQLCLKDILRPGDCALDVGANIGGLSIAMSRLVGPAGTVHAFEANPFTFRRLESDITANAAKNIVATQRAAWSHSNESISFYCDDSYYAVGSSAQRRAEGWKEVKALTVSLDDYCRERGLVPRAIKLDVEGVEIEVLRGAARLISDHEPSFVIEYYPAPTLQDDALEFLTSHGYVCYDTNLYQRVDREFYLAAQSPPVLVNVLALSRSSHVRACYERLSIVTEDERSFEPGATMSTPVSFRRAGRYLVSTQFDGSDEVVAALTVASASGEQLAYVQTQIASLRAHTNSNLVFEVDGPVAASCSISSPDGAAVHFRRIRVNRIDIPPAGHRHIGASVLSLTRRAGKLLAGVASKSTARRAG